MMPDENPAKGNTQGKKQNSAELLKNQANLETENLNLTLDEAAKVAEIKQLKYPERYLLKPKSPNIKDSALTDKRTMRGGDNKKVETEQFLINASREISITSPKAGGGGQRRQFDIQSRCQNDIEAICLDKAKFGGTEDGEEIKKVEETSYFKKTIRIFTLWPNISNT